MDELKKMITTTTKNYLLWLSLTRVILIWSIYKIWMSISSTNVIQMFLSIRILYTILQIFIKLESSTLKKYNVENIITAWAGVVPVDTKKVNTSPKEKTIFEKLKKAKLLLILMITFWSIYKIIGTIIFQKIISRICKIILVRMIIAIINLIVYFILFEVFHFIDSFFTYPYYDKKKINDSDFFDRFFRIAEGPMETGLCEIHAFVKRSDDFDKEVLKIDESSMYRRLHLECKVKKAEIWYQHKLRLEYQIICIPISILWFSFIFIFWYPEINRFLFPNLTNLRWIILVITQIWRYSKF